MANIAASFDEEIQAELIDLEIEEKRIRKKVGFYVFVTVTLTFLMIIAYFNTQNALFA